MESLSHHNLVKEIYKYVIKQPNIYKELIESDIFEVAGTVTKMQEGYIPDLYYNHGDIVIIGEAKTEKDLNNLHSIRQLKAYVNHLSQYICTGYRATLIIAVPWEASITAYRMLKRIIGDEKIVLIVINELGVYKAYEKNNIEK